MKSMKRAFGGVGLKRSADQQDIGAVLAEFKAVDDMLSSVCDVHPFPTILVTNLLQLIKDLKDWRNNWEDVLKLQYDASEAFATLYHPIEPTNDPEMRREPVLTPDRYMQKCLGLQKCLSELRDDLKQEIGMIDAKLLRPVEEAKTHTKMLQKTLKHRENMKRDYERYLGRAEHVRKKDNRTMKDEASLAKSESELVQAQIDYETADDQIRQHIPPVTDAVMSLIPHMLANQVMLQTTLVGQLYTILDGYCKKHRLPTPAPSDDEIVRAWGEEFTGFRKELEEGIATIAKGKAVQRSMTIPEKDKSSITGLGIRNKAAAHNPMNRKTSAGLRTQNSTLALKAGGEEEEEAEQAAPPKPPRPSASPSYGGAVVPSPGIPMSSKPRVPSSNYLQPEAPYDQSSTATTPSWPNEKAPSGLPPAYDQMSGGGTPSSASRTPAESPHRSPPSTNGNGYFTAHHRSSQSSLASAAANAVAAKKKPPPPVPTKRFPSGQNMQYVTAVFDFEGQGGEDLAFREGDRIRVVRKTESTDDWWTGELRGKTGSFPANYVQL